MKFKFLILFILFFVSGVEKVCGETTYFVKKLNRVGSLKLKKTTDENFVQYSINTMEIRRKIFEKEKKEQKKIYPILLNYVNIITEKNLGKIDLWLGQAF